MIDRTVCVKLPVSNLNCYAYLPLINDNSGALPFSAETFDSNASIP